LSESKKIEILQKVLGNSYASSEEMLFFCPKCNHHKRKMSVNVAKDVFKCWICDYHGISIRKLIRNHGSFKDLAAWSELTNEVDISSFGDNLFDEEEIEEEQKIPLPEEYISLANKNSSMASLRARKYLLSRGVTKRDFVRWKIGYCDTGEFGGRIIVPSFGRTGYANYFIARTYTDDWKKYMNPPAKRDIIFNELYLDFDKDLVVVEGVFDAIVAGPNSVPILGSTLREQSKLFQEIIKNDSTVYIALDPDAEKKATYLIKNLLKYGIEIYKTDITPYGDVGEMTREEFQKRKDDSKLVTSEDYLLLHLHSLLG
jgi:DNA primase